MVKQIFVNLPIKNLDASMAFFRSLGFDFNMQFTNEDAACLVMGDNIYAMLLTEPFFKGFTTKEICNSATHVEVLNAIALESRAAVDAMLEQALASGGLETRDAQDYGWMYSRALQDLDGHIWEVSFMDEASMPENPAG